MRAKAIFVIRPQFLPSDISGGVIKPAACATSEAFRHRFLCAKFSVHTRTGTDTVVLEILFICIYHGEEMADLHSPVKRDAFFSIGF